jgi:hypothetical protein
LRGLLLSSLTSHGSCRACLLFSQANRLNNWGIFRRG